MRIGSLADVRRSPSRRSPLVPSGLVLGPELIVNGSPMASSGWTVGGTDATHIATFSGGTLRFQSDTTSPQLNVSQSVLTASKSYQFSITVTSRVSGSIKTDAFASVVISAPGSYIFRATAANGTLNITRSSANVDMTISEISVKEVLGG